MPDTKPPTTKRPVPPAGAKKTVPAAPVRRATTVPQTRRGQAAGPDRFSLYFIAGATAFILLFGAGVWGLRGLNNQSRIALAATPTAVPPTATLEVPAALVSPQPFATVTASAPDALTSGPFAASAALQSVFTNTISNALKPPPMPAQIPQPQLALAATSLDFGPVRATGVVTRDLILGNVGARPLQVQALVTDCACLAVTAGAARLPSGSRTHLVIAYDPAADSGSGPQTHHLAVLANDPQTPRQDVTITVTRP